MIQLPTSLLNGSLPNRPIQGWEHDIYTVILMDPKSSRCLGSDVKKKKDTPLGIKHILRQRSEKETHLVNLWRGYGGYVTVEC